MIRSIILTLTLAGTMTIAKAEPYQPKVGQRHPDFALANIETGKPVALSNFRGQKLLLIHFASW